MEIFDTQTSKQVDWKSFASAILPHVEEGIAAVDTQGRLLLCNDAFLTLIQKTVQQVQGQALEYIFDKQAEGKWLYSEAATRDITYREQTLGIRLIPSFTAAQTHSGCVIIVKKPAGGKAASSGGYGNVNEQLLSEIQAREKLQAQLQESQHFIKQVADASPDVLYVYDLTEKKSIYINREIYNKLGYTPEEFYAFGDQATRIITHPDDFPRRQAHFEAIKALKDGEVLEIEYRVKTAKGQWLWVRTRDAVFKRTPGGIPYQLIGVSQDITEIKNAEEKLVESQYFIQQIADTSPDHLYVFDILQNKVVYINKEITGTLGYTPEQLYSMGENVLAQTMHPDDILPVTMHLQSFAGALDRDIREIEYRMKDVHGQWHWILARETVFKRTAEGYPSQIVGISRDITASKQAQEELRYKNQLIENMVANFPVILSRIDRSGIIQESIGMGLRSFGLEDNQMAGANIYELDQQAAPYIHQVMQGEKTSFVYENVYKGNKKYFQNYYFLMP